MVELYFTVKLVAGIVLASLAILSGIFVTISRGSKFQRWYYSRYRRKHSKKK